MGPGLVLVGGVALLVVVTIAKGIRIVQQAQTMIIERFGKYHKTLTSGINLIMPWIDKPRAVDWHQTLVTPAGDSYSRRFPTQKMHLPGTVCGVTRPRLIDT